MMSAHDIEDIRVKGEVTFGCVWEARSGGLQGNCLARGHMP